MIDSSQEPVKIVGIELESGIIIVGATTSILIWRLSFRACRRPWDFLFFLLAVILPVHTESRNWICHALEDLARVSKEIVDLACEENVEAFEERYCSSEIDIDILARKELRQVFYDSLKVRAFDLLPREAPLKVASEP